MNIKDYLKYYIGCPAVNSWFPEDHWEYNKGWVLTAIQLNLPNPYKLETGDEETWTDSVKPILRRIQSLKEHEAIELGKLLLSVNGDRCRAHKTPEGLWRIQYGNVFGEHWVIDGSIFNQFQTHYLLSLGIDLFGLLDAGLAIDASTIKTGEK